MTRTAMGTATYNDFDDPLFAARKPAREAQSGRSAETGCDPTIGAPESEESEFTVSKLRLIYHVFLRRNGFLPQRNIPRPGTRVIGPTV